MCIRVEVFKEWGLKTAKSTQLWPCKLVSGVITESYGFVLVGLQMLEVCARVLAAFLRPRALDLGGSVGGSKRET